MLLLAAVLVLLALCLACALSRRHPQDPEVADALAQLERRLHLLVHHLQERYPNDTRTQRLAYGWDGRLTELRDLGAGSTVNKRAVSVCVRNAAGVLQDINTATLVCLHEIGHVCTPSEGHTPEFWGNFRFLLKEAVAAGIYEYQDFEQAPVSFCGSVISSSPLTCVVKGTCT